MSFINKAFFQLASLVLAFGWCACAKKQTNVERGIQNGELYIGIGAEPAALDPHLTTGLTEYSVMLALLEGLTTLHPKTMAVEPGVAQSWVISEDRKRYTFHFDPEARWSNGDRVTPEDFIFSFKRILSPALGAPYAYMLYPMRGAEAFHRSQSIDFGSVGVSAPDAHTLVIELESPTPYFLNMLSHNTWWPVHPPTILEHGAITDRISKWTKPGKFIGNGPFILERWRLNNGISVVRNPHYRKHSKVGLNGIHFLPIAVQSEERAFRAGHLHLTSSVPIHRIDWYRKNHPERLRFDTALGVYYYMLNTKSGPLADTRVRQALAYSINREDLTKHILRAGQKPAYHFTPPNTGGYQARARLPYDPQLARKRLAEAGFPDGKEFPKLQLLFNTSESHRTLAVAIQQIWKRELGIDIELHNQEWKAYLATRQSGNFDILRAAWYGDYDDPNTFLSLGESRNGNNHTNWHDPHYDALIKKAAKETDPVARMELFQEAEAILIEALPVIPIYFYVTSRLIHPAVKGWYPSLLDNHPYQAIQLKK
ncbi:MAG: peptide ABC transporter substrate-binding protein [Verrucomicrobia bacterium]|nr:peptide ABC transporter substrate-binding protein [Verrucomicrobiota bacterium]